MDKKLEARITRLERMMSRKNEGEDFVTYAMDRTSKLFARQILDNLDRLISTMNRAIEFQVKNGFGDSDMANQTRLYLDDINDIRNHYLKEM